MGAVLVCGPRVSDPQRLRWSWRLQQFHAVLLGGLLRLTEPRSAPMVPFLTLNRAPCISANAK